MRRALQFLFALLLAVVVAQEPNFDPSKSPLSGPGTQGSQAADGMLLYVTANDGSGNTPPCLSATYYVNFKLTLTNVANASLSQTPVIASCTNGVYLATYIGPQILGVYTLTAGYQYPNNTVIPFLGSPVNVTAAAGSINPPSCVGNPPSSATAGDNVIFNITAYDKYGNVNKTCISENNWKILLSGSGNVYQGSITNCANGLYTAQFNAQETARYTLTVTIFGQNIKNSPFPVVVNPGALDPSSTTVTGDIYSAVAGVNALLQITARDKFGNALNSCDPPPFSNWSISFNGALNISGSFDSCKSGIYNAHYMATVAKTYTYSLTYNGANIAKSPYTTVVVANSAISATNSYPSGNPLGSAIAGQTKQYQINVFDAYGNAIHECVGSESTWTFTMALTSDPNTKCTTEPQFSNCFPDDGYFTVLYTCELAGNYTLTNYYNNQIIKNGQFPVRVMPGPIAPQQCKASGSGLQQARAGVETYFEIETFDQYNNKISLCELSPFTNWRATLSLGGYSFLANVLACNNGVYTFEYVLNMTGTWTLIVYYDNQFVVQPFWQVEVVPGPPAPGGCVAFGDGLVGTLAGVAAGFAVTCVDQFANPINDCGYYNKSLWNPLFVLQGSSYNFSGLFVSCTEGSSKATPATTNFTYSNTKAGTYDLTIYYGSTIATRTYNPVIHAGPFDPLHSYAEGPGVESQSLVAGDQTDFSIIAADSYGNKLDTCSMDISKITVAFNPNVTAFNITGCTLGVTDAVYTPTRAGNLSVIIQYNGRNIQGDPYYPYVIAGPTDAAYTVARGDSLVRGVAGNTQYFQIQAYDRFNNPAACVETSNFVVTMTLNSQTVSGVVANCSNGLYIAYYIVTVAAVWELDITYQGTPIQSNPWHPNIVAGSVDAKTCVATPSTLNLQAGQAGNFSITCGDSYNNPVKSCFISSFAFTNGSITKIADCTQGVYTATSSSITAGTYVQTITFNSVPISNQVTIIIVPGPVSNANSYLSALSTYPVGQLSYYYVYPLDQYNNPIYDCSIPFDTAINGTTTVNSNKDSCDGAKYTYVFNVTVVGSYKIYVNYGSSGIKNSPASFNAVAGPISPANSNLTVDANITAGTSGAFTVYAYDAFGNKIQSCANYSNWVITILEEPNNNNGVVQRCSSGIYNGIIIPYRAGIENLRVTIDGLDVGGQGHTAQYTVYAAAPAANTSIAHPVDGSVGNRTTWSIEAYDAFGNQVLNCVTGTNFVVSLKNDQHSCPGTSDCSNGNYSGHYTCNFAGTFDVLVTLNNQNVTTIPPQVNVVAGGPDDSKTKAYGPGVSPQPAIKAGESTYFVIVAQDSFGNQASYCPDYPYTFNFSADPVFIQSPVQVCSAPGNTTVTYTATRAGNYNINIYGKAQIAGGPYSINIVAGPFDPTHITNASVIYQSGSVGQIFVVPLVVRDQYNNTIPGCSKDEVNNFTVTFDASDSDHRYNGHVNCENNQYVVYYQANHTDVYTLTVLYDGQHVEFSPFPDVKIGYGDPDFSKAYATGPGVEAVRTPAGVYDDFTVFLVNKYGYNIISCYPDPAKRFVWTIKIASPSVTAEFVGCFENGENPAGYNFRFNATVATKYKVDISINNTVIANNANYYALIVPGPIYPPYTHVDVPYNTSVVPYDGYFYIIAEDRFHNPVQNLDGLFDAYLAPLCANTTVHCSANNTEKEVNCTYTVAYGGIYCIDIIYNEAEYLFFASYPGLEVTEVVHTGINLNIIGGSACSDGCNNQGVCTKPNVCSCWTNRTGDACEFTHSSKYMKLGLAIGLIIGLAIAFFIIGILIGYCIFKYLNRGSNSEVPLLH